jgi:hypothetical protein
MPEVPRHRVNVVAVAAVVTVGFLAGFVIPASPQSVTAFEGARLIVGDGHVIEHATLVVEDARIAQAGHALRAACTLSNRAQTDISLDSD